MSLLAGEWGPPAAAGERGGAGGPLAGSNVRDEAGKFSPAATFSQHLTLASQQVVLLSGGWRP